MTVHPHLTARRKWVLGKNRITVNVPGRFNENELRYQFEGFWTGEKWKKGTYLALPFDSEADALAYIEANFARLDA